MKTKETMHTKKVKKHSKEFGKFRTLNCRPVLKDSSDLDEEINKIKERVLRPVDLWINTDYKMIGKRMGGGAMGGIFPFKRRSDKKLMIGKMIKE